MKQKKLKPDNNFTLCSTQHTKLVNYTAAITVTTNSYIICM